MPNDRRRQRYRSKKQEQDNKPNGHYVLAKRPDVQRQLLVQPKILLKTRTTTNATANDAIITSNRETAPIKTIIVQRSTDNLTKPGNSNNIRIGANGIINPSSSNTIGVHKFTDPHDATLQEQQQQQQQQDEPVLKKMLRPVTLISGSGVLNFNARKVLLKNSSDFLVVGVIGEVGVGKSTVMNLLARNQIPEGVVNDDDDDALYRSVFCFRGEKHEKYERLFNTKLKNPTRARTESFQMYITGERTILIDSPPVLNAQRRQVASHNELTDLKNIVNLMNICHILIVVYEGTLNIEVLRLLCLALHTKPEKLSKLSTRNYVPSVMFIKNRAKRLEYTSSRIDRTHNLIRAVFDNDDLNIYVGTSKSSAAGASSTAAVAVAGPSKAAVAGASTIMAIDSKNIPLPIKDDQKKQQVIEHLEKNKDKYTSKHSLLAKTIEPEQKKLETINHLMLPEFYSSHSTTFHPSLKELQKQLRERLFATSRNKIHEANNQFTESDWFETVVKSIQEGIQKFEEPFEETFKKYKTQHHETTTTNSKTHTKHISSSGGHGNGNGSENSFNSSNSFNNRLSPHNQNHTHIGSLMDLCNGNKVRDRARGRRVSRLTSKI